MSFSRLIGGSLKVVGAVSLIGVAVGYHWLGSRLREIDGTEVHGLPERLDLAHRIVHAADSDSKSIAARMYSEASYRRRRGYDDLEDLRRERAEAFHGDADASPFSTRIPVDLHEDGRIRPLR